ncbi:MAG: nuclear transport factor 2 family protein [Solirubrobacterales bacterium]
MSEANTDLVLEVLAAFNRGDTDAVLDRVSPDVVHTQTPELEGLGVVGIEQGHEGLLKAFASWPEQWDDFQIDVDRVVADAGDRVVIAARQRGRGAQSAAEVDAELHLVFTVREKVTRVEMFGSEEEAMAAAEVAGDGMTDR